MVTATLAALGAAALFAMATALQHRSAGLVTDANRTATAGVMGFVSKTLRHPLWILGSAADAGGLGLHALALRDGPLTLVQPLLMTGLVFALPLRQLLEHRRPQRSELGWAVALVAGLTLLLTIATPTDSTAQPADPIPTLISVAAVGLGILTCSLVGRRATGRTAAVALGTATGLAFAATAGLLKETMQILDRGVGAVLSSWSPYAMLGVGAIGLLLNQLAYQAGPLRFSLPVITTVDPIASLVIGVAVFDEQFRHGPADLFGEAVGLALIAAAAAVLAWSNRSATSPETGAASVTAYP
jgi:hypothetical protein